MEYHSKVPIESLLEILTGANGKIHRIVIEPCISCVLLVACH